MLFLYLYYKKENFLPLTTWIFLSSLGIFLTSNLGTRADLIKQSHANNIIKTNRFDLQNEHNQSNVTTIESKKLVTLLNESIFIRIFPKILILDLLSIKVSTIDTRLHDFQTQSPRSPPNECISLLT
ncbi:Ca2+/H+ antiporter [Bartonella fuyuanensis]|uniref:Ca2+/H+ antiporter n=1 Tax=Bartonella fuyuanensis TaxID=1460968 RepID=A0A840DSR3_9HYPH|nr:Ca2+/H+ antiporter [Bartonella fuyuanensis]